jgi:hypothetical protein
MPVTNATLPNFAFHVVYFASFNIPTNEIYLFYFSVYRLSFKFELCE